MAAIQVMIVFAEAVEQVPGEPTNIQKGSYQVEKLQEGPCQSFMGREKEHK